MNKRDIIYERPLRRRNNISHTRRSIVDKMLLNETFVRYNASADLFFNISYIYSYMSVIASVEMGSIQLFVGFQNFTNYSIRKSFMSLSFTATFVRVLLIATRLRSFLIFIDKKILLC